MDLFHESSGHDSAISNLLSELPRSIQLPRDSADACHSDGQDVQVGEVITKIEDIFESIVSSLLNGGQELTIHLKRKPKVNIIGADALDEKHREEKFTKVTFPSKCAKETRRFCALLNVLTASHSALVTGNITTKRDVFYRDPSLFLKQSLSDRCIDDISYTLGTSRGSLNIVAAAKGLISGGLKISTRDKLTIDYATASEGYLMPNVKQISRIEPGELKWVLVVEKEATFRTLSKSEYWQNSTAGKGLLVTAKGYPDLQTRQFLNFLVSRNPKLPIFALVDYDVDGIGIMSTYKYGSIGLGHEADANVPTMEWLGVRCRDFIRLNKYKKRQEKDLSGLLQLSARDRRLATKMLEREQTLGEVGKEVEWRQELQTMLMLNIKAEIQILEGGNKFEKWLDAKLRAGRAAYKKKIEGRS